MINVMIAGLVKVAHTHYHVKTLRSYKMKNKVITMPITAILGTNEVILVPLNHKGVKTQ